MALPFLPVAYIPSLFGTDPPEPLIQLLTYFKRQGMTNSIFPITSLSIFEQRIRTNNDVEGWHKRLNMQSQQSLNLHNLIQVLHVYSFRDNTISGQDQYIHTYIYIHTHAHTHT